MVQVFNLAEQAERSNLTSKDTPSSPLSEQAHALMRDGQARPQTAHRAEPGHIDFSAHNIYANCDGSVARGPSMTQGERDFKPDMTYSGPQGREFLKKMQDQREKPIELNPDGKYEVKPGDTLSTLAERTLRDGDHKPSQKEIQAKVKELEMLNGDQLGNRHLLKPGMQLKLNPDADDVCRPQTGAGNVAPDEDLDGSTGPGAGRSHSNPDNISGGVSNTAGGMDDFSEVINGNQGVINDISGMTTGMAPADDLNVAPSDKPAADGSSSVTLEEPISRCDAPPKIILTPEMTNLLRHDWIAL